MSRHSAWLLLALLGLIAAASAWADDPIAVDSRAADHPGYGRIVFAVARGRAVPFTASSDGTVLTIRFEHPVAVALEPIRRDLGDYVGGLALSSDGLTVTAQLRRPVELRPATSDEATLVLDLVDRPKPVPTSPAEPAKAGAEPAKTEPPKPAAAAPVVAPVIVPVRVGGHPGFDRIAFDWPKPVGSSLTEAEGAGTITFDAPARINLDHLSAALPKELRPARMTLDGRSIILPLPAGRHLRESRDGNIVMIDVLAVDPKAPPPAAAAPKVAAAPEPPPPAPVVVPAKPPDEPHIEVPPPAKETKLPAEIVTGTLGHSTDNSVQIRYTLIDDGLSLRFDWRQPSAAAIFRRADGLWVVFDQTQKLDFTDFRAANWPVLTGITQIPSRTGTVLRLQTWSGFNPLIRRAGAAWIVDLKALPQRPDTPVEPDVRTEGANSSILYPVLDPRGPFAVIDPDAGDELIVIPLPQLGQGMAQTTEYPDFRALQTSQGLAFRRISDALEIRIQPNAVEVTAPGGLMLSSEADRTAPRRGVHDPSRIFDLAAWQGPDGRNFTEKRQALQLALTQVPETERAAARLALARFFFANGMGPETLGVLAAIEKDTPALMDDPSARALRGAAEALCNQFETAAADLADPTLDDKPDALLWRAVIAAEQGRSPDALALYAKAKEAQKTYPPVLHRRVALTLADAAIRGGDTVTAGTLAAEVLGLNPDQGEADLARVIEGRIAAISGDSKKALDLWGQVIDSPLSDLGRAQAVFATTVTRRERGEITNADAIIALDRLRYAWRGDEFEAKVLHKLAEYYIADNDYRSGFLTLRHIIETFPDSPLSAGIASDMQQYFVDLFLGKPAETVAPQKALAFYEEFKELTPAGQQGDAIIRKLADRLVSLDLLDRAATLLQTQVTTRLSGLEQARVATQLAVVRLLDRKPDAAVTALDIPVTKDLPADLQRQRQELRAKALAELNKPDDALKVLTGDATPDADRLRADIYRRSQNWAAMAALLQQHLQEPGADGMLDKDAAAAVESTAEALALAKDSAGLAALQKRYAAAMDKSPYKDEFRAVSGGNIANPANFKSLVDKFAQIGELHSFMTEYRQRISQDKLSTIN